MSLTARKVDAEKLPDISESFEIESVPAFIALKASQNSSMEIKIYFKI